MGTALGDLSYEHNILYVLRTIQVRGWYLIPGVYPPVLVSWGHDDIMTVFLLTLLLTYLARVLL